MPSFLRPFAIPFLLLATWPLTVSAQDGLPHLRSHGTTKQLMVGDAPFLMLGGELGNSSASSLEYMAELWPELGALGLNTVLAPVYWDLLEPEEGQWDFSLVDGLLAEARKRHLRLVLLWFGSWKNSMSSYVPGWVKRDLDRFPRALRSDGSGLEILTPFSDANANADARAFRAMMQHLHAVDQEHTVVMVQVQNEIGMIPEARDHHPEADRAFGAPVPKELIDHLRAHGDSLHPALKGRWTANGSRTSGSWTAVFGDGPETEEVFMAWYFARYVERVAEAGHAVHPLPLFVNAALVRPGHTPGQYPSAGPLPHLIDVWRAAAPTIDFLAPDIYFPNFVEWASAYHLPENPLFVPEAGRAGAATSVADAFYSFGELNAMGYSPFSIEDTPADHLLVDAYRVLSQLSPLIVSHQGQGTMRGVRPPVSFDGTADVAPQVIELDGFLFNVDFIDPWTPHDGQRPETHGGLIIALGNQTFLVAGVGLTVTFSSTDTSVPLAGIERIEEGSFTGGAWKRRRVLNGDQSHQGRHLRLPPDQVGIQQITLYRYR